MSVYDEMSNCIEDARSTDACEYHVYSEMFDLIANAEHEYDNLKAKYAKLRDLVRDMWQTISKDDGCGWDIDANCCTSDECNVSCRYWFRMKDLGIEVMQDEA